MDTRYWGPSGWKLLHLMAAQPTKPEHAVFWDVLPFVLPCKFCRASLTKYYRKHKRPTQGTLANWLWKIHNEVNAKLRDQGQTVAPDPPFKAVEELYETQLNQPCTSLEFPGWEFLFSIADCFPGTAPSAPMPDYDPEKPPKTLEDRNEMNLLTPAERIQKLRLFWTSLPKVLPFKEWVSPWLKSAKRATQNRKSALSWLYRVRCELETSLDQAQKHTFHGLCKAVARHRSGCSKSRKARTCRALRTTRKK